MDHPPTVRPGEPPSVARASQTEFGDVDALVAGLFSTTSDTDPPGIESLDDDAAEVLRRELRLLLPAVRADPDAVLALLHPDFTEIGASGRVMNRTEIAESLAGESLATDSRGAEFRGADSRCVEFPADREPAELQAPVTRIEDLTCTRLATDVIQITYTAQEPGRISRRNSVWVRDAQGPWSLRFHQGTVVPPG